MHKRVGFFVPPEPHKFHEPCEKMKLVEEKDSGLAA